jgi:WD40 repeat protein
MDIKVNRAFGCQVDSKNDMIFCACSDGVLRVFRPATMQHVLTFEKPPPLGASNQESGVRKIKLQSDRVTKYADVTGVVCDEERKRVLAIYSDKMVFLWDFNNLKQLQITRTFFSHNGPIHDIQKIPRHLKIGLKDQEMGKEESSLTRFVTCSSDRTIRFWHFLDGGQV